MDLGDIPVPWYRQEGWTRPEINVLPYYVLFTLFVFVVHTYLDIRQHRLLKEKSPPTALMDLLKEVDAENEGLGAAPKAAKKFAASQSYGLDKSNFHFFEKTFDLVTGLAVDLTGWMPWLWDTSAELVAKWGLDRGGGDMATSLVFVGLALVFQHCRSIPFGLYSSFVVEERHGFNKSTLGLFFADKVSLLCACLVKSLLLTMVIGAPALAGMLKIMELGGRYFYVYVWFFMFSFSVIMITVAPVLIMPLFNQYTPLEDGDLKSGIEALAARVNFPLTKLFVVDGSRRSAHSNAYFYGFFKNKRIVLFDTLIKQAETSEIVSILGHELGHWKMSHTLQGFAITQTYILAAFSSFALATEMGENLRLSFGFSSTATLITLHLFSSVMWTPVDHVLDVLMNMLSRKNEFQADAYATQLGYAKGLKSGLVKLQLENLGNMNPDPWYSKVHYSHPPLVERLQAIGAGAASGTKKAA
ncbi:unnamed protein product [Sphacelaria rigidula]